jgi:anti-sigma regulatory factor (Ser/Thr protein kinase)
MGEGRATLELRPEIGELARLATTFADFAAQQNVPADVVNAMHLSLEEVVTNVIVHGYKQTGNKTVQVRLAARPGEVIVEVEDEAPPFDPLARAAPDLDLPLEERPIGGLGIHLVKNLMDAVTYQRDGNRNRLTLTKRWVV